MTTFTDIGNPPPPAYFWDVLAEVAQIRLHDPAKPGDAPIAEGKADVEFTLRDIKIPLDEQALLDGIQKNLAANPRPPRPRARRRAARPWSRRSGPAGR